MSVQKQDNLGSKFSKCLPSSVISGPYKGSACPKMAPVVFCREAVPPQHFEDIFELGTTAENYGEYYGTTGKSTANSTAGRDPHDRLGGRPGQIRNPPALINTIMQLNPANTYNTTQPTA
jgi:hypothetical protein